MKPTEKNRRFLKMLGFTPDEDPEDDPEGWWSLSHSWTFKLDCIKSFKHLVKRLKTEFERGAEEGTEGESWKKRKKSC